ncbi:Hypothetical predicted protein [Lecanosticta acicola]|uniref:FAS1 domain-containing protein n=1 Tax=Lecanosticta acicola TaxID=111012 RepID=A0AAI9EA70_9PEZI|nr:Hypothetical predicted protein [Lecanosticta acicola]
MKLSQVLPLAALGSAFVLPPEEVLSDLAIEDHHGHGSVDSWIEEAVATKDHVLSSFREQFEEVVDTSKHTWKKVSKSAKSTLDEAFDAAGDAANSFGDKFQEATQGLQSWVDDLDIFESDDGHHRPPHHKKPHHKPNQTIYQLIASSEYTTTLAKLISEYDDLVEALNSTSANYTVFAPSNKAFDKIPDKAPKPSKEFLKKVLSYHVVPGFYPAGRVLQTHTVPTLLIGEHLSSQPEPQRLTFKLNLRGLTVNFYSRIFPINIFATNGVIHGVDSILLPPPKAIDIVDLFPGEFSTLELGLSKTGLLEKLNTTDHAGGTIFAPSNFAFQKLGPRINAFLFSQHGLKYLKALLEYHVVPGVTLYSDAIYKAKESDVELKEDLPGKGLFHIDLPTLLEDKSLSVDIARYGGFISIKINAFATVGIQDGLAEDGVIQVVRDVIIPPKKIGGGEVEQWDGTELSVEDLKERLEPVVAKQDL